jgi:hypothetical protein
MISYLDDNPVGKVLAGVSAGLLGVLVLLGVVWALPPSGSGAGESEAGAGLSREVPQLATPEPIENYAEITNRPVFNESRQPIIGAEEGAEDEEFAGPENVEAPEVELAGVVITPDLRVATLRLKEGNASLMAREGQPLEGNFGSWKLSRIDPREAILESDSGEQVRLELQVHDAMIDEPPAVKAAREAAAREQAQETALETDQQEGDRPLTRAEEIRQRIAQRREELRRAAEEKDGAQAETPQVDYRQAIQAMMAGKKDQEQDESEQ